MNNHFKTGIRVIFSCFIFIMNVLISSSQKGLTLEEAMQIAEDNSPNMKRTRLNLIRSQENLNAQNAALKSQFSLSVNPLSFNQNREFNDLISEWNTTKIGRAHV